MIKYTVPTGGDKIILNIDAYSKAPCDLIITGTDYSKSKTVYFKREINGFQGANTVSVPMPITPDKLSVMIYDKNKANGSNIEVSDLYVSPLDFTLMAPYDTDLDIEYYIFMFWFCENFKYLPNGVYASENGNFHIIYEDYIPDGAGGLSTTPSCINRSTADIEVARKKCQDMSVYMLAMILFHEYCHYRLQSVDEQQVDNLAVQLYKVMGFPSSEALYSFTNGFTPDADNQGHISALESRTANLYNYLSQQSN